MTTTTHPSPTTEPRAPSPGRPLLAAAVLGAPVLIGINSTFHPEVEFTAESFLAGAESGPTAWFLVHTIAAVGALLGIGATMGLRTLVPDRGRRLADAALTITVIGAPILAMSFAIEASVLQLAASALDPNAAIVLAEAYVERPEFYAIGAAVALTTLGGLSRGIALALSGTVPRWQALTLVAATIVTALAPPSTPIGPIAFGVVSFVSVFFALKVAGVNR